MKSNCKSSCNSRTLTMGISISSQMMRVQLKDRIIVFSKMEIIQSTNRLFLKISLRMNTSQKFKMKVKINNSSIILILIFLGITKCLISSLLKKMTIISSKRLICPLKCLNYLPQMNSTKIIIKKSVIQSNTRKFNSSRIKSP